MFLKQTLSFLLWGGTYFRIVMKNKTLLSSTFTLEYCPISVSRE
jgi:hypothetical protein